MPIPIIEGVDDICPHFPTTLIDVNQYSITCKRNSFMSFVRPKTSFHLFSLAFL